MEKYLANLTLACYTLIGDVYAKTVSHSVFVVGKEIDDCC